MTPQKPLEIVLMLKTNIGNYAKERTNKQTNTKCGYWLAVEIREEKREAVSWKKNVKRERESEREKLKK